MSILLLTGTCIVLLAESALTTYVAVRAWPYRPARLFVMLVGALTLMQLGALLRLHTSDLPIAYVGAVISVLGLCAFAIILLLFFSAIFVPAWWRGSRPIRWIALPYALAFAALAIDLLGRFGLFVNGIRIDSGFAHVVTAQPGGSALIALFAASWLVHFGILGVTFVRRREVRKVIGLLAAALVLAALVGISNTYGRRFLQISDILQTLPFLATLAYTVVRTRLVDPTSAALDLAIESISEVVVVLAPDGQVSYANPRAGRLGFSVGRSFAEALRRAGLPDEDQHKLEELRAAALAHRARQQVEIDFATNLLEVALAPVADARGRVQGALLLGRDITELERRNKLLDFERTRLVEAVRKLSHLAGHDALTNLPNRRSLEAELNRVIARAQRGRVSALLFLDLDNFKLVNDTLGHAAGDTLLIELTRKLARQLRPSDVIARLGGDEFAVVLEGAGLEQAQTIAERMRLAVEAFRFTMNGHSFELSLSIGLVLVDGQHDAHVLLAQADIAMYSAKDQGRNRTVTYPPHDASFERLSEANQWVTQIKDALQEDHLALYFQPIVRLHDAHVEHYEVLIRLLGRQGEIILPKAFLPAAERFGLMPQLDRWIVRRVVGLLQMHPSVHLFMNLSNRSLVDETLTEFIAAQLRESGVAPARLGFELTETLAIQDMQRAERWIGAITAMGCRFVIDGFGAGFTSFAYLRNLPNDHIKIDGSFIRTIDQDPSSRAIVQAIHLLAQSLGKVTVAECVESAPILEALREIGIVYGQGYYLGQPTPALPDDKPRSSVEVIAPADLRADMRRDDSYALAGAERRAR